MELKNYKFGEETLTQVGTRKARQNFTVVVGHESNFCLLSAARGST